MISFDLCCGKGHRFEGWFASDDDFHGQLARGLVECPLCADRAIVRLPTAPRLNLSGAKAPAPSPSDSPAAATAKTTGSPATVMAPSEVQALWLKAIQQVMRNTEDVGERFPEEARRIHYGETANRGIRGQASAEDRAALADEGIEVMALPLPEGMKGPKH